jgi:ATP-dependent DNA helicase RecG
VGPQRAALLARLGIVSLADLVTIPPRGYEDRTRIQSVADLVPGRPAVLRVRVDRSGVRRRPGRRTDTVLQVADATGALTVVFWGQGYRAQSLRPGTELLLAGPVERFGNQRALTMSSPTAERLTPGGEPELGLLPIYPLTEGLSQSFLRTLVARWVPAIAPALPAIVPPALEAALALPTLAAAIASVHRPATLEAAAAGRKRLALDELFLLLMTMAKRREERTRGRAGATLRPGPRFASARKALPFALTRAQETVLAEILADLARPVPMHRLLEGDVGSGKTVVALLAAMAALDSGHQVAILAPTEILALQHARVALKLLPGVTPILLTGSLTERERRQGLAALARGDGELAIGTHALLTACVQFRRLGLVIVDEQHRFGVREREALTRKGLEPDVLVMTATPIPRSLCLTAFGDLDLSLIAELPPGRPAARTHLVTPDRRERVLGFLAERLARGEQALWITPRVEADGASELAAAKVRAAELARHPLLGRHPIGLLHGRLPGGEKEAMMARFRAGRVPLLVATTVVEVGIDVSQVTVVVIEHPERFGLSQLHQLRGRAGRGSLPAHTILLVEADLDPEVAARLRAFTATRDGFQVSELDLAARGPGALLGAEQHGFTGFQRFDPIRDRDLIPPAQAAARDLLADDPDLEQSPALKRAVAELESRLGALAVTGGAG